MTKSANSYQIYNKSFTNGVVTTGVVVGGIFFAGDQLLGVE